MTENTAMKVLKEIDECNIHTTRRMKFTSKLCGNISSIRENVVLLISRNSLKEKQILLVVERSLDLLFSLIDNEDHSSRLHIEESLDMILQALIESFNIKLAISCLVHRLKLNENVRATVAAFNRFAILFNFMNRDELDTFILDLFPVLCKLVVRTEETVQQAIIDFSPSIFGIIREAVWNRSVIQLTDELYNSAVLNIGKKGSHTRAALIIIEYLASFYNNIYAKCLATCFNSFLQFGNMDNAAILINLNLFKAVLPSVVEMAHKEPEKECLEGMKPSEMLSKVVICIIHLLGRKQAENIIVGLEIIEKVACSCLLDNIQMDANIENFVEEINKANSKHLSEETNEPSSEEQPQKPTDEIIDPLFYPEQYKKMTEVLKKEDNDATSFKTTPIENWQDVCSLNDSSSKMFGHFVAASIAKLFLLRGMLGFAKDSDVRVSHKILAMKCLLAVSNNTNLQELYILFGDYKQHIGELKSLLQHSDDKMFTVTLSFILTIDNHQEIKLLDSSHIIQPFHSASVDREKTVFQMVVKYHNYFQHLKCYKNMMENALLRCQSKSLPLAISCMDFLTQISWIDLPKTIMNVDFYQNLIFKNCLRLMLKHGIHLSGNSIKWLERIVENFQLRFSSFSLPTPYEDPLLNDSDYNPNVFNISSKFTNNGRSHDYDTNKEKNLEAIISNFFLKMNEKDLESFAFSLNDICLKYPPNLYPTAWNVNAHREDSENGYVSLLLLLAEKYARSHTILSNIIQVLSAMLAAEFELRNKKKLDSSASMGSVTVLPPWHIALQKLSLQIMNLYYSLITKRDITEQSPSNPKFSPLNTRKIISSIADKSRSKAEDIMIETDYTQNLVLTENIMESLRGASHNYERSIQPEVRMKFIELLNTALESMQVLIEIYEYSNLDPFLNELLYYLKSFMRLTPNKTISCLQQVFKVVFKKNVLHLKNTPEELTELNKEDYLQNCTKFIDEHHFERDNERLLGWLSKYDGKHKEPAIPRQQVVKVLSKLEYFVTKIRCIDQMYFSIECKKASLRLFTELVRAGLVYRDIDPKLLFFQSVTKQCRKRRPFFWHVSKEMIQYLIALSQTTQGPFKMEDLEILAQYLLQESNPDTLDYALNIAQEIVLYLLIVLKKDCKLVYDELIARTSYYFRFSKKKYISLMMIFICKSDSRNDEHAMEVTNLFTSDRLSMKNKCNSMFPFAILLRLSKFRSDGIKNKMVNLLSEIETENKQDFYYNNTIISLFLMDTLGELESPTIELLQRCSYEIFKNGMKRFFESKVLEESFKLFLEILLFAMKKANFQTLKQHFSENFDVKFFLEESVRTKNSWVYLHIMQIVDVLGKSRFAALVKQNYPLTMIWDYFVFQLGQMRKKFSMEVEEYDAKGSIMKSEWFYDVFFHKTGNKVDEHLARGLFWSSDEFLTKTLRMMNLTQKGEVAVAVLNYLYKQFHYMRDNAYHYSLIQKRGQCLVDLMCTQYDLLETRNDDFALLHMKFVTALKPLLIRRFVCWGKKYNAKDMAMILSAALAIIQRDSYPEMMTIAEFFNFIWREPCCKNLYENQILIHLPELSAITNEISKQMDYVLPITTVSVANCVEVKSLGESRIHQGNFANYTETCRDLFLKTQELEWKSKLLAQSKNLDFRNLTGFIRQYHRHPLIHQFAIAPREAMMNDWTVNIVIRPLETLKVPLVSIHQLVNRSTLDDFMLRINSLGCATRQQFEEFWISFFGVLSLTPTGTEVNEDNIDQILISCEAINMLTEMLQGAHEGNQLKQLPEPNGEDEEEEKQRVRGEEAMISLESKEAAVMDSRMNPFFIENSKKEGISFTEPLDTTSCLRALFENYSHWFGKGYDNIPSLLLQQTINSIGRLADLYDEEQFYRFAHVHMRNIIQTGFMTPYFGFVCYAFVRSMPTHLEECVEKDSKNETNAQLLSCLRRGLSSEWTSVRLETLRGINKLLEAKHYECLKSTYLYLSINLEKELSQKLDNILSECIEFEEQDVWEECCPETSLMWKALLRLLEMGELPEERKQSILKQISTIYLDNNCYPYWVYRSLTKLILAHMARTKRYWHFFHRLITDVIKNYDVVYWSFKHVVKFFIFLVSNGFGNSNRKECEIILDEIIAIYKKSESGDAVLISSFLHLLLLQLYAQKFVMKKLLNLFNKQNPELNSLTLEMIMRVCEEKEINLLQNDIREDFMDKAEDIKDWPNGRNIATMMLLPFSQKYHNRQYFLSDRETMTEADYLEVEESLQ